MNLYELMNIDFSPSSTDSVLELEVPGELVLGLLQLLPLVDVRLLDVVDLGLHGLQLGKQLEDERRRQEAGFNAREESRSVQISVFVSDMT